ncbi:MAG: acetyltransferase [Proteobacteria bacterium]|nr:acetyltransferase [Pseudomonadota bacterium]
MSIFRHLVGVFALTYISINLTLGLIPLLILALLKLVIPLQFVKDRIYQLMLGIYAFAVHVDSFLLKRLLGITFDVVGLQNLDKRSNYLVISNHRSWADILILQSLLINGAPIIKFIVKQEVIFIPLVGLICWAYEYPFVKRSSLKDSGKSGKRLRDLSTINQSLENLGNQPTTIINFVEGTRFNLLKSKKTESPFPHLLKPRAGGLTYILNTFGKDIDYVLDFTIAYDTEEPVFWNLMSGKCKRIKIEIKQIALKDLMQKFEINDNVIDYTSVSNWLKRFWQEKNDKLKIAYDDFRQQPVKHAS